MKNVLMFMFVIMIYGCAAVNTFPTVARSGDTVSVMIGGSEEVSKQTVDVTLTDSQGIDWNLKSLGMVRSVFNLRMDAKSEAQNYTPFLDAYFPWYFKHEPLQSVLVLDLPDTLPPGNAMLTVHPNINDDSSGVSMPYTINIDIIEGSGQPDSFLRQAGDSHISADLAKLEPAPYVKINFSDATRTIGALSYIVDFDQTIVTPGDINVYVPESTVRGTYSSTGEFGTTQRMVYWRQDGDRLYIDIVAPQGISTAYMIVYIIYPPAVMGNPGFQLVTSKIYDTNGSEMFLSLDLSYHP